MPVLFQKSLKPRTACRIPFFNYMTLNSLIRHYSCHRKNMKEKSLPSLQGLHRGHLLFFLKSTGPFRPLDD
jgi:hypothetical protein